MAEKIAVYSPPTPIPVSILKKIKQCKFGARTVPIIDKMYMVKVMENNFFLPNL